MNNLPYQRAHVKLLLERFSEKPRFMIFVAGPRQVGKTTLVQDALRSKAQDRYSFVALDRPDEQYAPGITLEASTYDQYAGPRDRAWLVRQWQHARMAARKNNGHVLVLDEIQKLSGWSEVVKGLWDADRAEKLNLHVVLLGSSPLLMLKGMTESLAGRYELIKISHWSFTEMCEAFGFDLEDFIYFGGYPGSYDLIRNEARWRNYVRESLIMPSIEKDILMLTRVDKPALLKQLFYLGIQYSGKILAYNKMLGQLQDAGNTTTLAHYMGLLEGAGLVGGLQKYAGSELRRRASTPKFNVLNTALMAVGFNYSKEEARSDRSHWGRMVESAVGAHLFNTRNTDSKLYYWQEGAYEVDFILEKGKKLTAIEVKSGKMRENVPGLDEFEKKFGKCRKLLIGEGGISITEFLSYPAEHWL